MNTLKAKLGDFVLMQVGWFACVLGAADGRGWVGPLVVLAAIAVHVAFIAPAPDERRIELQNVLRFGVLGAAVDAGLTRLGLLVFDGNAVEFLGMPLWMAALWFLFPILFNSSLAWMRGRHVLAALFGLVGGPLSYLGGESLGALELGPNRTVALLAIGVVWGTYTPLALHFSSRSDSESDAGADRLEGAGA